MKHCFLKSMKTAQLYFPLSDTPFTSYTIGQSQKLIN